MGAPPRPWSAPRSASGEPRQDRALGLRSSLPRSAAGAPRSPLSGREPISRVEPGAPRGPPLPLGGLRGPLRGLPLLGRWPAGGRAAAGPPPPAPAPSSAFPPGSQLRRPRLERPCGAGRRSGGHPAGAPRRAPNRSRAWRTWARPPASRDRCAWQRCEQGGEGRVPGRSPILLNSMDFVHAATPAAASIV